MRRWIGWVSLIALLQGCATQLQVLPASGSGDPETTPAHRALRFQNPSIEPEATDVRLMPEDLQPGDIILTSVPTLTSVGIQLMTLAPVSHAAIYIGDHQVIEAVRSGVRIRRLDELLAEEAVVLAFRRPELSAEQARNIGAYLLQQVGTDFNYLGIALHVPFAVNRKLCELPLMPSALRDVCVRAIGGIYHLATSERRFFCSQLVLQAYRHAGVPITDADPRLISPADILHMREGDVPSVMIHKPLRHLGHLKYQPSVMVALER
jgi:hypothetical protein